MLNHKTPRDVLQALSGLRSDPRFIKVLEYLKAELASSDDKLRQVETLAQVHKYQGASLTLLAFIQKAQEASSILNSKE